MIQGLGLVRVREKEKERSYKAQILLFPFHGLGQGHITPIPNSKRFHPVIEQLLEQFSNIKTADCVLFNLFDKLEEVALRQNGNNNFLWVAKTGYLQWDVQNTLPLLISSAVASPFALTLGLIPTSTFFIIEGSYAWREKAGDYKVHALERACRNGSR
ncbi:hypothetical protein WN943_009273 [Citrus x changshan-huyou]